MLEWLRRRKARPTLHAGWQEAVDSVCRHVEEQVAAYDGPAAIPMADRGRTMDMLTGAYVWGLLDGYLHHVGTDRSWASDGDAEAAILAGATAVFARLFGDERARWLRRNLPQWGAPWPDHPALQWALRDMRDRGNVDSRALATDDPLLFARGSSLLGFLMQTTRPRDRMS